MKKAELIARLRARLADTAKTRGEKAILGFFIEYLRRLHIEHDEKYNFYQLDPYLPQIIGDAFEVFRASDSEWVASYRNEFEEEAGHKVPNLTVIGDGCDLDRSGMIYTLGHLFGDITEHSHVENNIRNYLSGEMTALQLYIDKFLRLVYRNGLYDLVKDAGGGMGGRFGEVDLRCFISAGRSMFTFARKVEGAEISVTFIAEDGDPNAYSAGLQSVFATLPECMVMIDEVIANWPDDADEQVKQFVSSDNIMPDVVAMMKQAD